MSISRSRIPVSSFLRGIAWCGIVRYSNSVAMLLFHCGICMAGVMSIYEKHSKLVYNFFKSTYLLISNLPKMTLWGRFWSGNALRSLKQFLHTNATTLVASSRRSVSWGAARKKAREKTKKKRAKGSERTPVGKLNKRSFRPLIWLVVFSCQQMSIRP